MPNNLLCCVFLFLCLFVFVFVFGIHLIYPEYTTWHESNPKTQV